MGLRGGVSGSLNGLEDIVAKGDRVAVRHTSTGTPEGNLMGIEATGREVEMSVMILFRFEDGKIAEVWLHDDRLSMLQQLGVVDTSVM